MTDICVILAHPLGLLSSPAAGRFPRRMATFVIVHGGFGGGWEWTPVARLLRGLGHEVYTPTLSGMGEHCHLAGSVPVGLSTHVQDIVGQLEFEDLHQVVLVGSGYGGIPVTCAADRIAHRVGLVVYLDALVPYDSESALDLLPKAFGEFVRESLDEFGETWRVPTLVDPLPPPTFSSPEARTAHRSRLRDQPAMTFVEPVYLTGAMDHIPRAFLRCTMSDLLDENDVDPVAAMIARAHDGFWHYRELAAPHDPHLTHPQVTVRALTELVANVLEKLPPSTVQLPTQIVKERAVEKEKERVDWVWSPS
jgi:pimeloyl-ACP methyl ester carboxylesterase